LGKLGVDKHTVVWYNLLHSRLITRQSWETLVFAEVMYVQ